MKQFIAIAFVIAISGALGSGSALVPSDLEELRNCSTTSAPSRAPRRHTVVPQPV